MKFISTYDAAEGQTPIIDSNHPKITDSKKREELLTYLRSGKLIMAARHLSPDILDAQGSNKVPNTFFTDGVYIWPGSVIYYLEKYYLAPNGDFLNYFNTLDKAEIVGEISDDQVKDALNALRDL